jgi:hypothetical protein
MRQGDGTNLLGPSDPRSASIGVIYVAPTDDRQSVLTAILTQDKLGFKQVVIVLPDQNKAFQRPIDFDGLKNMRRGLKADIVFIAPGGPGPAEFARQRRFPVYSSLESFTKSITLENISSKTENGSSSRVSEENASPNPVNGTMNVSREDSYVPTPEGDEEVAIEKNSTNGHGISEGIAGLTAGTNLFALADEQHSSSTSEGTNKDVHEQTATNEGVFENDKLSSNGTAVNGTKESKLAASNDMQNLADSGPEIITFSSTAPRPKITRKFPVVPAEAAAGLMVVSEVSSQQNGSHAVPTNKQRNTGKTATAAGGAAAVGVGTALAGSATGGGGGQPPSGNVPGGPGGSGVGGTSRQTRILLAILLGILTVLLIGGITIAAIPGGINNIAHVIPGATGTATVTITPDSKVESNTFQVLGVTGVPNPNMREIQAHILSATSATQSKTVTSSGSIPGARATGSLTFLNSGSTQTFGSFILRGRSGVTVSFNGPITVYALPGVLNVTGYAVSVGSAGNIGALDISGSCCAAGITVKNGTFSGGQNPQPNSVVQQGDINTAADSLATSLTPGTKTALQRLVKPNEQVVPNTLQCNRSTFTANHVAGDHAPNVTVTVAITCKEEVYNQQAALTMAEGLLTAQANKDLGPNYALTGNVVAEVNRVAVIDTKGTVAIFVKAEGVWVYQFSNTVQQNFKNQIQNKSVSDAITYLKSQPGVSDVTINNPNGNTLPDAAHIKIEIVAIAGTVGTPTPGTGTVTPGVSPTIAPTSAVTPPAHVTPTATQGLGGG